MSAHVSSSLMPASEVSRPTVRREVMRIDFAQETGKP